LSALACVLGTLIAVLPSVAGPHTILSGFAEGRSAARDSLGCTLTVVAPHIDHSGTKTNGMMKAHSAVQCAHPVPVIIISSSMSYWNGARWVRISRHHRVWKNVSSGKADTFHDPACDHGRHRYRNLGMVGIFNADETTLLASHHRIAIATRC
jgi:hypothetical protein